MRVVRRGVGWALGLIVAVGLGASPFAASAQSPPPSTGEPAADGGGPIPLAEVATRVAEIHSLLEAQDTAISPSREVQEILDRLPKLTDELRVRLDADHRAPRGQPAAAGARTDRRGVGCDDAPGSGAGTTP